MEAEVPTKKTTLLTTEGEEVRASASADSGKRKGTDNTASRRALLADDTETWATLEAVPIPGRVVGNEVDKAENGPAEVGQEAEIAAAASPTIAAVVVVE